MLKISTSNLPVIVKGKIGVEEVSEFNSYSRTLDQKIIILQSSIVKTKGFARSPNIRTLNKIVFM